MIIIWKRLEITSLFFFYFILNLVLKPYVMKGKIWHTRICREDYNSLGGNSHERKKANF